MESKINNLIDIINNSLSDCEKIEAYDFGIGLKHPIQPASP